MYQFYSIILIHYRTTAQKKLSVHSRLDLQLKSYYSIKGSCNSISNRINNKSHARPGSNQEAQPHPVRVELHQRTAGAVLHDPPHLLLIAVGPVLPLLSQAHVSVSVDRLDLGSRPAALFARINGAVRAHLLDYADDIVKKPVYPCSTWTGSPTHSATG